LPSRPVPFEHCPPEDKAIYATIKINLISKFNVAK
jgi:hypothetical protein